MTKIFKIFLICFLSTVSALAQLPSKFQAGIGFRNLKISNNPNVERNPYTMEWESISHQTRNVGIGAWMNFNYSKKSILKFGIVFQENFGKGVMVERDNNPMNVISSGEHQYIEITAGWGKVVSTGPFSFIGGIQPVLSIPVLSNNKQRYEFLDSTGSLSRIYHQETSFRPSASLGIELFGEAQLKLLKKLSICVEMNFGILRPLGNEKRHTTVDITNDVSSSNPFTTRIIDEIETYKAQRQNLTTFIPSPALKLLWNF